MRLEGCDSWDRAQGNMGCWGESIGTVQVEVRCTRVGVGKMGAFRREKKLKHCLFEGEHLSTIPETESNEVIKSSVEILVPVPSESEGISDDTCDLPFCDNSPPLYVLNDHFKIFSDFNDDCTSSDDDSFDFTDYVEASPLDSELVSLEEVKDDILHKKLLNINILIAKIESLNDNPTPDCVL
uniref:Uncharacterized protein n=1 Tax=Tanacetum cinerariifolium TaxID=118510 RepID=A0A6L2JWT6_TANCI|nr:hypothetical protein [Tanacetum cinerariifolium]